MSSKLKTIETISLGGNQMSKTQVISKTLKNYQDAMSLNPNRGFHAYDADMAHRHAAIYPFVPGTEIRFEFALINDVSSPCNLDITVLDSITRAVIDSSMWIDPDDIEDITECLGHLYDAVVEEEIE